MRYAPAKHLLLQSTIEEQYVKRHSQSQYQHIRWGMDELLRLASGDIDASDHFTLKRVIRNDFSGYMLFADGPGSSIKLRVSGDQMVLTFHTHAWCGEIMITTELGSYKFCLFSEEHGFKQVHVRLPGHRSEVSLTTLPSRHTNSKGCQLWFCGVAFSCRQEWMPLSIPASPTCSLTNANVGSLLTLRNDSVIGAEITARGVWGDADVAAYRNWIKPGMTAVDIGANIGHHTVLFSSLVGHKGSVYAMEPQNILYNILCGNLALNGCSNTTAINTCVGESEGTVNMLPLDYSVRNNFGALGVDKLSLAEGSACPGQATAINTLDNLLLDDALRPATRVDFIKIDVQAFELFVLRGATKVLRTFRPTLFLELSPYWMSQYYDYRDIYTLLQSFAYDLKDRDGKPLTTQWNGTRTHEWDVLAVPR